MAPRLELHAQLKSLLGSGNVYFQPPPTTIMVYPCIRYERDTISTSFADDSPYKHKTRYRVTVIDPDPDSVIHKNVGLLPTCVYDRFYTAENLNHDVYTLYF